MKVRIIKVGSGRYMMWGIDYSGPHQPHRVKTIWFDFHLTGREWDVWIPSRYLLLNAPWETKETITGGINYPDD